MYVYAEHSQYYTSQIVRYTGCSQILEAEFLDGKKCIAYVWNTNSQVIIKQNGRKE
jgi:hypothetical protein